MAYADPAAQRAYQRAWIADRRAAYFADKACVRCGATDDLELDHIDPQTKISHAIWSWSTKRRETELAKCQVLCKPCHQEKTIEQMPITQGVTPYQHGTSTMYGRGCRCDECHRKLRDTQQKKRVRMKNGKVASERIELSSTAF